MEKDVSVYDFISEEEICETMEITKRHLGVLRGRGLPHYKIGGKIFYLENEMGNWLFENTREDNSRP